MSTHRFTVTIPNATAKSAVAELRLEPASPADFGPLALDVGNGEPELVGAGIAPDPCEQGEREMKVKLAAHGSEDVHVTIETAGAGIAAMNLVDTRDGQVVGGVMLACVEPSLIELPGGVVKTPKPCPATLVSELYPVDIDADPSVAPRSARLAHGAACSVVAAVTNPRRRKLTGLTIYLEHLGGCDAEFEPATWNAGDLRGGDIFYATWTVRTGLDLVGTFEASVVVAADGTDPTRLTSPIQLSRGQRVPAWREDVRG